jgi:hypothetical protein
VNIAKTDRLETKNAGYAVFSKQLVLACNGSNNLLDFMQNGSGKAKNSGATRVVLCLRRHQGLSAS